MQRVTQKLLRLPTLRELLDEISGRSRNVTVVNFGRTSFSQWVVRETGETKVDYRDIHKQRSIRQGGPRLPHRERGHSCIRRYDRDVRRPAYARKSTSPRKKKTWTYETNFTSAFAHLLEVSTCCVTDIVQHNKYQSPILDTSNEDGAWAIPVEYILSHPHEGHKWSSAPQGG